jgi:5-methylthioadenosine/S-adenosylhomocysteine deaminase
MATLNPAEALGIASVTGSIEAGKAADLCAIDMGSPGMSPCYDPVSHVAYAAGREDVSDVWVGGKPALEAGRLVSLDPEALARKAEEWRARIAA